MSERPSKFRFYSPTPCNFSLSVTVKRLGPECWCWHFVVLNLSGFGRAYFPSSGRLTRWQFTVCDSNLLLKLGNNALWVILDRVDIVIEDPIEHKKKLDQTNFIHSLSLVRKNVFSVLSNIALSVHNEMTAPCPHHISPGANHRPDIPPPSLTFTAHNSSGAQVGKFQPCLHHSRMRNGPWAWSGAGSHLWTGLGSVGLDDCVIVFRREELVTQIMQECDFSDHSLYPGAPMTSADTTLGPGTKYRTNYKTGPFKP